jgi:hypothetical protein
MAMNIKGRRGSAALVIVLIVVIVLAVVGGIWYWMAHNNSATQPSSQSTAPGGSIAQTTSTYQNADYGISFAYPSAWTVKPGDTAEGDYGLYTQYDPGAVSLVTVEMPTSSYPGTGFEGAYFNLSVDAHVDPGQCFSLTSQAGPGGGGHLTIGGVVFDWRDEGSVAAGTDFDTRNYSGYTNGICYYFNLGDRGGANVSLNGAVLPSYASDMTTLEGLLSSVNFISSAPSNGNPASQATGGTKIAFIKDGEVWTTNEDGSDATQLTNTSGAVNIFSFSPDANYLAYSKVNSGNFDYETDVLDLSNGQVVQKITQADFQNNVPQSAGITTSYLSLDFLEWYSDSNLGIVAADNGDFNPGGPYGPLEVNMQNSSMTALTFPAAAQVGSEMFADILQTPVESYVSYPYLYYSQDNPNNYEIHAFNLETNQDQVLLTWNNNASPALGDFSVSHSGDNVALATYSYPGVNNSPTHPVLWLYKNGGNPIPIITTNSLDAVGVVAPQWSYDDQSLAFLTYSAASSSEYSIVVVSVANPYNANGSINQKTVYGGDSSSIGNSLEWTKDGNIVFEQNGGIYLYNAQTGEASLISASSSDAYVVSS